MKRLISLLLSVLLVMTFVPTMAGATEGESWQTFVYEQDGPEFFVKAEDFAPASGSYTFLAAAYDAAGKMIDVKTADATVANGTLLAGVNFEEGGIEADVSISSVKTMLWNSFEGLRPVAIEGNFDISEQTKDENGILSSLTNGFYRSVTTGNSRYSQWDFSEDNTTVALGYDGVISGQTESGAIDNNLTTGIGWSGANLNRIDYIWMDEAVRIDRVVTYCYDDPVSVPDPRQKGTEYYLTTAKWSSTTAPSEELMPFWNKLNPETTAEGVLYLGTSESQARTAEDADAKLVYDVPEDAGNFQFLMAKKIKGVGGTTYELQAYEKVQSEVVISSDRPEVNVATWAAAFSYGAADDSATYMAVDGDSETAWISANTTAMHDYLVLDLGTAFAVSSIDVTLPAGVAQNFTVYGANTATFTDKTALTGAITGLAANTETKLAGMLSAKAFRYIIFEQAAEETSFGFNEIKVNTQSAQAEGHVAQGPVELISENATCVVMTDNLLGWNGNDSFKANAPQMLDADPSNYTSCAGLVGETNPQGILYVFDLGQARELTHVAYQLGCISSSMSRDCDNGVQIIGIHKSNGSGWNPFRDHNNPSQYYDVLATIDEASNPYINGIHYDTGLLVFDVPEAFQNTKYQCIGILKTECTDFNAEAAKNYTRLGASTLQAYAKGSKPEFNVATEAAAFAYGNSNAFYAVDGSLETDWVSLNNTELNDYLILDLGKAYSVSSIQATIPADIAQNFTVYGANDAKQTDKTALTGVISGLAAGEETDLGAIASAEAFRYIIFEQQAAETSFGFTEIKVNTRDEKAANHVAMGAVVPLTDAICIAEGAADGWTGNTNNKATAQTNMLDGNPTTTSSATGGKNPAYAAKYFFDLGVDNAKTLTHIAYQANPTTSTNVYFTDEILFVASNDPECYKLTNAETKEQLYEVLAEMGTKPRFVTGSATSGGDTGLLVFNVPEELQNTAYRYIGIIKTENTLDQVRLGASTLQFYTKYVEEPEVEEPEIVTVNVAENAAAFAYGDSDAFYAVDGSLETDWISLNDTELNDYLILDLGKAYSVSSIQATIPADVAQNFTVYGANDAKQTDKTALTGTIAGLAAGEETDLGAIASAEAFRYIIFEQQAAETSFGFTEIKVNTLDEAAANHVALGAVVPLTEAICIAEGKVDGWTGNDNNKAIATTNMLDGNPTTTSSATGGKNPAYAAKYFFDLGVDNAKTLTHIAYQANPTSSTNVYFTDEILFVASNDPECYKLTGAETEEQLYEVLAEMGTKPRFVTGSATSGGDTGLLVFNVPEELQNTAYRYIGIIKIENTLDQVRLGASTLQFYTKVTE